MTTRDAARFAGPLALLALAALAHLSFHAATPVIVWTDSLRYLDLSLDLPGRLATARWDLRTTPGYPFFLWVVRHATTSPEMVAAIQQWLGVLTCLLVWLPARKLFGAPAALAGAALVALSPFRHYYAQTLLSEQLAEFLLAAGFAALVLAIDQRLPRLLVWRALAGLALGLATLTRPSLAPAVAAATLTAIVPAGSGRRRGVLTGMLLTGLAATIVVAPWLAFNAQRGVSGFTGNLGYQLHAFADYLGVGGSIDVRARFAGYTAEQDRALVGIAPGRFAGEPLAYLRGMVRTTRMLFFPLPARGDVAPKIGWCGEVPVAVASLARSAWPHETGLEPAKQRVPGRWRCALHRALIPVEGFLVPAGWVGLAAWGIASLRRARWTLTLLATLPFACMLPLCVMLQANTRYAFPCEALAVGFGVPAGLSLFARRPSLPETDGSPGGGAP